jgi:hypothetical protein
MPDPIDKFTILRALGNLAHLLEQLAKGETFTPEILRECHAGTVDLRERLIATTPEQLDAPPRQPIIGVDPAPDGETLVVTVDGVVRMRLGCGLTIGDEAGVITVGLRDDEGALGLRLDDAQEHLRQALLDLAYAAPETLPMHHGAIIGHLGACVIKAAHHGASIDGRSADGAGHGDEPAPAHPREPAQREGDDRPAAPVTVPSALHMLVACVSRDGLLGDVQNAARRTASAISDEAWPQAVSALRELAARSGEVEANAHLLADALVGMPDDSVVPF